MLQNLRFGLRQLRLNPGFAAVSILSLALGIGANTAIFQLIDAVRLRSLPVAHPEELAEVAIVDRKNSSGNFSGRRNQLTYPQWDEILKHSDAFSSIMAWGDRRFNLSSSGEARYAEGLLVSGEYFQTLAVSPLAGRLITNDDDQRGCGSPGAVISYSFWQKQFGGARSAVGQKIPLDGRPFEVIGITPAGFYGVEVGHTFDVALPLCAQPIASETNFMDRRNFWWLSSFGRLKPGWTVQRATAQLKSASPSIFEATLPPMYRPDSAKSYRGYQLEATTASSGVSSLRKSYETPLYLLIGIAALVLVIACANLANLMLARASAREREMAVRLAVGASRGQIVGQLLTESLTIAAAGCVAGIVAAQYLSRFLIAFLSTAREPIFLDVSTDWRVFGFTALLGIVTCLLFGLAPALRASRGDPASAMKTRRGQTAGKEKFGFRRVLAAAQVALSLMLLVSSLLFVSSLRNLMTSDKGFRDEGILVARVDLEGGSLSPEKRQASFRQLLQRIRNAPGVESAATAGIVPISGSRWNNLLRLDGARGASKGDVLSNFNRIGPGYFQTMGTSIVSGRDFNERDTRNAPTAAIVDEAFTRKYLDGANPVGLTMRLVTGPGEPEETYQVVGLVRNMKYEGLRREFTPTVFLAAEQDRQPNAGITFVIRSRIGLDAVSTEVKSIAADVQPMAALEFRVLKTQIGETVTRERLMAVLSAFFGGLAVILATIGLYGVMSYMVSQRQSEIGIRMALGAGRAGILGMVLRDAGMILVLGLAVGAGLSIAVTRLAASLVFGVKPNDPVLLIAAAIGLAAVVLAASSLPARRAANLDPMTSLRQE